MENQVINAILTRRSIRNFQAKQLEPELLDTVLKCGTYAPTCMGYQSPFIVAVQNPEDRETLRRLNCQVRNGQGDPYYGAPTILLVFAPSDCGSAVEDGTCVLNQMMLAAHALGAAACWIHDEYGMFQLPGGKELLKKWGLPETLRGIAALAVGYADAPAPEPKARKENYITRV